LLLLEGDELPEVCEGPAEPEPEALLTERVAVFYARKER
jgi:hypothetical protein